MTSTARRTRVPVEERREQILEAALAEFSRRGLHGGSTVAIAAQVGISQPNIFRVYPTKHELFVSVLQRVFARIETTMLTSGERATAEPLQAMSDAWCELMADREIMFMLLQGYAAAEDPVIGPLMQEWTQEIFERTEVLAGVGEDRAHDFFAQGMLYMVAAAMDLPAQAVTTPWAGRFLDSGT